MTESEPVLRAMGAATWSAQDGTAYEVPLEGINHVVGAYSSLVAAAEQAGDADRVRELTEAQATWAARRQGLSPARRAQVDAVTVKSSQVLKRLRGAR